MKFACPEGIIRNEIPIYSRPFYARLCTYHRHKLPVRFGVTKDRQDTGVWGRFSCEQGTERRGRADYRISKG